MTSLARWLLLFALICGFLDLGAFVGDACAQEWTRFRGPNGSGVTDAKTIPVSWTEKDYNWKIKLPEGGHSSPVLWGDKIFLICANDEKTAQRMVLCLSAKDGRTLWTRKYASKFHKKHRFNSFASSTPAVDAKRVYVSWSTPSEYALLALDHDGKDVWRRDLGPYVSQHSCGTSPIVYEDMVVIGNDQDALSESDETVKGVSFLLAVDRETGKTRWKIPRRSARVAYSTPCVYRPPGGAPELIFNSMSHGVTSIDPRSGSVNWELASIGEEPLLNMRSVSSPVLADGLITASCGSGAGGNYLVGVRPGSAKDNRKPENAFKVLQRDGAPYVPTPIAKNGLLFLWGDRGVVSCVDARSGKLHWRKRVGGDFYGSPVCVNDKLYCISTGGQVVVLAVSDQYKLLARNELGELSRSTPAVADGRMYLRTFRHLISIGGKGK